LLCYLGVSEQVLVAFLASAQQTRKSHSHSQSRLRQLVGLKLASCQTQQVIQTSSPMHQMLQALTLLSLLRMLRI
jgi:hypothetical protein